MLQDSKTPHHHPHLSWIGPLGSGTPSQQVGTIKDSSASAPLACLAALLPGLGHSNAEELVEKTYREEGKMIPTLANPAGVPDPSKSHCSENQGKGT